MRIESPPLLEAFRSAGVPEARAREAVNAIEQEIGEMIRGFESQAHARRGERVHRILERLAYLLVFGTIALMVLRLLLK